MRLLLEERQFDDPELVFRQPRQRDPGPRRFHLRGGKAGIRLRPGVDLKLQIDLSRIVCRGPFWRRSPSMRRLRAMVKIQAAAPVLVGSNNVAFDQIASRVSCANSSALWALAPDRSMKVLMRGAKCSNSTAKAARSCRSATASIKVSPSGCVRSRAVRYVIRHAARTPPFGMGPAP